MDDDSAGELSPQRSRRRARVARNLASPSAIEHTAAAADPVAPAEQLRARLAATDRAGRFRQRLVEVQRQDARRRRRVRLLRAGLVGLGVLACVVTGLVVGVLAQDGAVGTAAGLVATTLFLLGRVVVARLAEARGSEAWDWQAGRHRLLGRPAKRVQDLDRPRQAGVTDPRR